MAKIFIDTNILVYSMDQYELKKRDSCRKLLNTLGTVHEGVISTQVIQEFYVASTKKLHADPLIVKNTLKTFGFMEIVIIDMDMIYNAIDISLFAKLSFWDALIVSASEYSRCDKIWSEDLNHGQIIRGVEIVNPLTT